MKHTIISSIISLFFVVLSYSQELHIFGGQQHNVYLGCLNCSNIESESIWNINGNYGNNSHSNSIWNDEGIYGSPNSNYSPWYKLATYPPILKDNNNEFYGYLSTNEVNGYRADFALVKKLYDSHNLIKKDVAIWHDKIFNKELVNSSN